MRKLDHVNDPIAMNRLKKEPRRWFLEACLADKDPYTPYRPSLNYLETMTQSMMEFELIYGNEYANISQPLDLEASDTISK